MDQPSDTDANAPAPGLGRRRLAFLLMIPFWAFLDLASKAWMFAYLQVPQDAAPGGPYGRPVWLLDGFLRLSAHINAGAAFGMGKDRPLAIYALTAVLLPLIAWMAWRDREARAPLWALGAVLGGALGNIYDRVAEAGVRDFIELVKPWSPSEMLWPVFNVADMGIVGGVAVYFLWSLGRPASPGQAPAKDAADDAAVADESAAAKKDPPPAFIDLYA